MAKQSNMCAVGKSALIIGGCHVTGYGLNGDSPFWVKLIDNWGATSIDVRGQVSIARACNIIEGASPLLPGTIVVIQVGHYDVWKEFSSLNPITKNNWKKRSLPQEGSMASSALMDATGEKPGRIVMNFVRGLLLLILDAVFIKNENWRKACSKIENDLSNLVNLLKKSCAEKVVIVHPFPTYNPRINYYRYKMYKIVKNIETSECLRIPRLSWRDLGFGIGWFALPKMHLMLDVVHLNARGHVAIADIIAD